MKKKTPKWNKVSITLIVINIILWSFLIGTSAEKHFGEDQLENLLIEVDNADNEVQRLEWQDKTYLVFRYRGICEPEDHITIRANNC